MTPRNQFELVLEAGEIEHLDRLRAENCRLNPHRRRFGAWSFHRAGGCPGALADVRDGDVADELRAGRRELVLASGAGPFQADSRASHWIEAHVILHRD